MINTTFVIADSLEESIKLVNNNHQTDGNNPVQKFVEIVLVYEGIDSAMGWPGEDS